MKSLLWLVISLVLFFLICLAQKIHYYANNVELDKNIYNQLLKSVVDIDTHTRFGSGVLISSKKIDKQKYINYVITNEHITRGRFIEDIKVDGITGNLERKYIDLGIRIDVPGSDNSYCADVVAEYHNYDLSILSFKSEVSFDHNLRIASKETIIPLTPVYHVSYQLGTIPLITYGIISELHDDYILYTAPTAPGSSGGAVFRMYGNQFVLLGISYKVKIYRGQIMSHYAWALSSDIIKNILDENNVRYYD